MAEHDQQRTGSFQRHATQSMPVPAVLALISATAGLVLTMHYPIAPVIMTGIWLMFCAVFFAWSQVWLLLLPALLPLIGMAPWTGWITFEEQDILILAAAAAGYTRMVWSSYEGRRTSVDHHQQRSASILVWLLIVLFALSTIIALFRGMADAGGASFSWFQGYHEPMNSVRLVKSFFLALLLFPLWRVSYRKNPGRSQSFIVRGLMLGLAGAALATIWERAAFISLSNFSENYRTTGLFWEMHVGGAALDGFLALTLPFALLEFMLARTPARWGGAGAVMALATYSCLTTFSRGVYLAIPVGVAIFLSLQLRQQKRLASKADASADGKNTEIHLMAAFLLLAGFSVGAVWIFPTSGYRGMAVLLSSVALLLPLARVIRGFNPIEWLQGVVLSVALVLLGCALVWLLPKGAYLVWGGAVTLTLVMLMLSRPGARLPPFAGPMALAGFSATVVSIAQVANHWGGNAAWLQTLPTLFAVLAVCVAAVVSRAPLWPDRLRWQASTTGVMCMMAAMVGVMYGGAYMTNRFSTGSQDFEERLAHWQLGLNMLSTPSDWLLGKGLGRFPSNYSLVGKPQDHTGDYQIKHEGNSTYLTLTGGLYMLGWGELFRITQRIRPPGKTSVVTAQVRAEKDVGLDFEVCQKHLLYDQGCIERSVFLKGAPGVWQPVQLKLQGDVPRGDWYAPKLLAFSMAITTRGGMADLGRITLTSADGHQLLDNGDFSENMAHWFFSSDRYHLPWHIKNVFMNVLFDQGVLGVTLWGLMLVTALWRTTLGKAGHHPLAPALAGGLMGFAVVGLFDSLLDVPRLGWLFYLLLLIALTLPGQSLSPQTSGGAHRRRSQHILHNSFVR